MENRSTKDFWLHVSVLEKWINLKLEINSLA